MVTNPSDSELNLINKAQAGDRQALDTLLEEYRGRLAALIHFRLGAGLRHFVDPEDVAQETLLRAIRSIENFQWNGDESFLRWLGGIAEHVILKVSGKHDRAPSPGLEKEPSADSVSLSRAERRDERFHRLKLSIQQLGEDQRRVVELARIEGVPIKEIARRMQRSESAVKNLLLRALKNLRERFGDTESLHLPDRSLEVEGTSDEE